MSKKKFKLTQDMRDDLYDGVVGMLNRVPDGVSGKRFEKVVKKVWKAAEKAMNK